MEYMGDSVEDGVSSLSESLRFTIVYDMDENTYVTNAQLGEYFTVKHLNQIAVENTKRLLPGEIILGSALDILPGMKLPFDILTNESTYYGAITMLLTGCIDKYAEEYQSDVIIIPSSVHEVLLIPERKFEMSQDELREMIRSANEEVVDPRDQLSDHPYYYSRSLKGIVNP